jgi:hypothetical protein
MRGARVLLVPVVLACSPSDSRAPELAAGPREHSDTLTELMPDFVRASVGALASEAQGETHARTTPVPAWVADPTLRERSDTVARVIIQPHGGSVELRGIALVTFRAGSFETATEVTVWTTDAPASEEEISRWDVSLGPPPPMAYDVRIRFGNVAPVTEIEVVLAITDAYLDAVPAGRRPHLFARTVSGGDMEDLDLYEPIPSTFDPDARVVRGTVPVKAVRPPEADGSFSAILVVGTMWS